MSSSQDNEGNAVVRMLPRSRSEIKRAYLFLKQQLRRMGALHLLILRRERKEPLLHTAVKENRRDVVELLILIGVSPDVRGISWSTPLHEAAARGYVDILQLLLQHGADINAETSMGRSALFYLYSSGLVRISILAMRSIRPVTVRDRSASTTKLVSSSHLSKFLAISRNFIGPL
nr:transient receptor potential channel pyrexia-like isoform X2 [Halyomorpha halys]